MKRSTIKEWLAAIALVLLVYLLGILIIDRVVMPAYTRYHHEVEVPEVIRLDVGSAETALAEKGFRLVIEKEQNNGDYPEGTIIDQNPKPNALTKPGRRIYVTVSSGEKPNIMPNLVGKAAQDAIYSVQSVGLTLSETDFKYINSDYYPAGVVMAQSVPPGTIVSKDSIFQVTISLGNLPSAYPVPNLIGIPLDRAKKMIIAAGFALGTITQKTRPDLLPNTIIAQNPPADSTAEKSRPIDLMVSTLKGKADR